MKYVVAALYRFVRLDNFEAFQEPLQNFCLEQGVKGTLLLADEGINGTIAGTREGIDNVLAFIKKHPLLEALDHKESFSADMPFLRMKVRLKKEIVAMGVPGTDPNNVVGRYIEPKDWNDLINDPEVILIDTRNDYEIAIGKFKGAIDPETETFREFPAYEKKNLDPKKHKKIAMYCTGGIRCEKSTSYMISQGYEEVYHLKGGILKYLEEVPQDKSTWEGECFVFDNRVSVGHGLIEGDYDQCHACRRPVSVDDMQSPHYLPGVSCPHCIDEKSEEQRTRYQQRQKQIQLSKTRGEQHLGSK